MKPLFLAPAKEDLAICDALLDLGACLPPVFDMDVDTSDDARCLVPIVVTFLVKAQVTHVDCRVLVLPPRGGRGAEGAGAQQRDEDKATTALFNEPAAASPSASSTSSSLSSSES